LKSISCRKSYGGRTRPGNTQGCASRDRRHGHRRGVHGLVSWYQKAQLARVNEDVTRVEAKVQQMQDDIQLVDRLVEVKTSIMRRLGAIETLDRNRTAWVQNLQDLAVVIPEFLWLSEFHQGDGKSSQRAKATKRPGPEQAVNADSIAAAKNNLTLKGYCYTVSSLANLILNLQDSPRFSNIQLNYAKASISTNGMSTTSRSSVV